MKKILDETTANDTFQLPEEFVESISNLSEICSQHEDTVTAMLYRLMFRHEKDIDLLDKYADQILDALVGFGGEYAEEDYRNYLQYLQAVLPSEVSAHKEFFENELKNISDESIEDEF